MQIWDVEDRILMDKDHKKRPIMKKKVLRIIETLTKPMNSFETMSYMRNKF
jgi:hypothetical protein